MATSFVAMTHEELKDCLTTAVQDRIKAHESQAAAARAWQVPQSTVNEIANGKDRFTAQYLIEMLFRDGLVVKVELL